MNNHILIVEDDIEFANLLEHKFQKLGWKTSQLNEFESALECLPTLQKLTHCILDLNLSHHSALPLVSQIKTAHPNCKIIILTGYANVQTSIEAIKLGAVYLLSKPSSLQDILNAFEHTVNPKKIRLDEHAKTGIEFQETELIKTALQNNQFNISKTARQLGMHRRTLQRKMKRIN